MDNFSSNQSDSTSPTPDTQANGSSKIEQSIGDHKNRFLQLREKHQEAVQEGRVSDFDLKWELLQTAKKLGISFSECQSLWEDCCRDNHKKEKQNRFIKGIGSFGQSCLTITGEIAKYSLLFGVIMFIVEADTRETAARNQSWNIINGAKDSRTSSGRIEALQQLNQGCKDSHQDVSLLNPSSWSWGRYIPLVNKLYRDCISLNGLTIEPKDGVKLQKLQLPYADLQDAKLAKANLNEANFEGADLTNANLMNSKLYKVNLESATLNNVQLQNSDLSYAILKNASLLGIPLKGVNLSHTDLRGANLSDSELKTASSLVGAIYDCQTKPFNNLKDFLKEEDTGAYFIDESPENCQESPTQNYSQANLVNVVLRDNNLKNYTFDHANFQGADLRGSQLGQLHRANLRGADLRGVRYFKDDNFNKAVYDQKTKLNWYQELLDWGNQFLGNQLKGAYLIKPSANLVNADLEEADLQGANLEGAKLNGAILKGANLRGTNLSGANLEGANLEGAIYDISTKIQLSQGSSPEFEKAYKIDRGLKLPPKTDLSKFDLNHANLEGSETILKSVYFNESNLRSAILCNAHLEGASLIKANLGNARLRGAYLENARLIRANLRDAQLNGAHLQGADLRGTELRGTNLSGANLTGARLADANFQGAIGLTIEQIKKAKDYDKAFFDADFAKKLGINS